MPEIPLKKGPIEPTVMTDTGILFEGKFRLFILIPVSAGMPPEVVRSKFQWEMQQLKDLANRPSLYEVHAHSMELAEKLREVETIVN